MKSNLTITHNHDDLGIDEAVASYIDVEDGFIYALQDVSLKGEQFKDFIGALNVIDDLTEYDYSKNKNNINLKIMGNKLRIYVRGNSVDYYLGIYGTSESVTNAAWKIYLDHCDDDNDIDLFMHTYFMNGANLDSNTKTIEHEELHYLSKNYYPYIDTDIMFDQFFTGSENILLLVGEPGLGKSKMSTIALKHAFENADKLPYDKLELNAALENQFISVVYVKSTDVLTNDKFWRNMSSLQADFCIIDDLDYMLTKRDAEVTTSDDAKKNEFLNQFLSYTDGVEKFKTKFIITTNQKYSDIDSALLRKGRLFDILELRPLTQPEALVIWKENLLKPEDFYEIFSAETVLPADLGSEINKRLNDRISTATQPYLKEEGISKVQKASRVKKIGL